MNIKRTLTISLCLLVLGAKAQKVDYSRVAVAEESGLELLKISKTGDYVAMPLVKHGGKHLEWMTNRVVDVSPDGQSLAFLSDRNGTTNIFTKELNRQSNSVQRTNRSSIQDFSYSPDGENIVFSESRGKNNNSLYLTSALSGYVCRQLTSNEPDYAPIFRKDNKNVIFSRQESNGWGIWCYNMDDNNLSSYTHGMNPANGESDSEILICRINDAGLGEIWEVDLASGKEECIIADPNNSFTSPQLSPDKKWILLVGVGSIPIGNGVYRNTDLFVCRPDGTQLTQLTFHAADDLSPVWSADGKYIYFVSRRGDADGVPNIWRMKFNH